jgi:hypothetical protein
MDDVTPSSNPPVEVLTVEQAMRRLRFDPNNLNEGTPRGADLLDTSFEQYGAARSIVIDSEEYDVAGNKSLAAFAKTNPRGKVVIVETEGDTLVAVKRTDWNLATNL